MIRERRKERESPRQKPQCLLGLISEVTFLCHVLFVTQLNPATVREEITGDGNHLGPSWRLATTYCLPPISINRQRRQWQPTYSCLYSCPSTLAWKIPWTEEPGRLQSMGSLRVGHDWLHFHFSPSCTGEGNGNPLQYSWPGESQGRGAWRAAVYAVAQSWAWLKRLSSSSSISKKLTGS